MREKCRDWRREKLTGQRTKEKTIGLQIVETSASGVRKMVEKPWDDTLVNLLNLALENTSDDMSAAKWGAEVAFEVVDVLRGSEDTAEQAAVVLD